MEITNLQRERDAASDEHQQLIQQKAKLELDVKDLNESMSNNNESQVRKPYLIASISMVVTWAYLSIA